MVSTEVTVARLRRLQRACSSLPPYQLPMVRVGLPHCVADEPGLGMGHCPEQGWKGKDRETHQGRPGHVEVP